MAIYVSYTRNNIIVIYLMSRSCVGINMLDLVIVHAGSEPHSVLGLQCIFPSQLAPTWS